MERRPAWWVAFEWSKSSSRSCAQSTTNATYSPLPCRYPPTQMNIHIYSPSPPNHLFITTVWLPRQSFSSSLSVWNFSSHKPFFLLWDPSTSSSSCCCFVVSLTAIQEFVVFAAPLVDRLKRQATEAVGCFSGLSAYYGETEGTDVISTLHRFCQDLQVNKTNISQ